MRWFACFCGGLRVTLSTAVTSDLWSPTCHIASPQLEVGGPFVALPAVRPVVAGFTQLTAGIRPRSLLRGSRAAQEPDSGWRHRPGRRPEAGRRPRGRARLRRPALRRSDRPAETSRSVRNLVESVSGFGPLQPYLDDPTVEELWINEPGRVFVARRGTSELTTTILGDEQVRDLVERMLMSSGRRLDLSQPFVDAAARRVPADVVIPDVTRRHWAVNIRRFVLPAVRLDELVALGTLPQKTAAFLEASVAAGLNIVVAGGTQAVLNKDVSSSLLGQWDGTGGACRTSPDRSTVMSRGLAATARCTLRCGLVFARPTSVVRTSLTGWVSRSMFSLASMSAPRICPRKRLAGARLHVRRNIVLLPQDVDTRDIPQAKLSRARALSVRAVEVAAVVARQHARSARCSRVSVALI